MSFLNRRKSFGATSRTARVEPLEDRRLLSAVGHSGGLKLHRVDDLSIVQDLADSTMNIATLSGPGTSAITPGEFPVSNDVGVHVDVQWGSGKSAVRQEAFFDSNAQPDVVDVLARNPLPAGVHPVRLTLIDNGKVVDVLKETIRVEAKTPNGLSLHAIAGKPLTATVGYLPSAPPEGEQLLIYWGDQSVPDVIPQPILSGSELFEISGTHTYAKPGKYVISVTLNTVGPPEIELVITNQSIISTITVTRK